MRIQVSDGRKFRLYLPIPTGLALNRFTAGFACRAAEEQGVHISREKMRALFDAIHTCRKANPGWVLVEAESAGGEKVVIRL